MTILSACSENIARAAALLRAGKPVAFPTETVYGLGADASSGEAVARIFELKGRPRFNPLIVHVKDAETVSALGIFGDQAQQLAKAFWPGPLTLVVKRREHAGISDLVTAGLDTIALRVPAHPVAQALLQAAGLLIAAPSANRSGHVSATTAAHVAADFGDSDLTILDAGASETGLESTIVGLAGEAPELLRPGAVARMDIEKAIGRPLASHRGDTPIAPGQLESHYAPHAALRLNATQVRDGEALLAFGPDAPAASGPAINLSPRGDLREAAARLFTALRELDAGGARVIAVMPVPDEGLGEAINDRLMRAASPRQN